MNRPNINITAALIILHLCPARLHVHTDVHVDSRLHYYV